MASIDQLKKAENQVLKVEQAGAPSTYADQLQASIGNATKDYQYDFNADQLYQDYKKNYMTEAQKAKNNVINSGKQLTASRPDTYVTSSANQQYQTYMADANRLAPAFENLAYARYLMDQDQALKQTQMLGNLDAQEYDRYRDRLNDVRDKRDYEAGQYKYDVGYERDLAKTQDAKDTADKNYDLDKRGNELNQYLYLIGLQEDQRAAEAKAAAEAAAAAEKAARASSGSSGRSGGRSGGYGYGGGYDEGTTEEEHDIYNAWNSADKQQNIENLDWIQVPGAGRLSVAEVNTAMQMGYIGYWTDENGKDHYTLTEEGRKHYMKNLSTGSNHKITHRYAGAQE